MWFVKLNTGEEFFTDRLIFGDSGWISVYQKLDENSVIYSYPPGRVDFVRQIVKKEKKSEDPG